MFFPCVGGVLSRGFGSGASRAWRTSWRNNAIPFKQNRLAKPRTARTFASVFQLAGGSEDPPVFDITRTIRVDQGAADFVRVSLNVSAPEPPPTTAHGGLAGLCSPDFFALTAFVSAEGVALARGRSTSPSVLVDTMMRWRWLGLAALVTERAAPLNPLRRLLRRPPPVSDAR